ncbi:hypothetical protein SK128_006872, partial [Halocaridina rubra]
NNDQNPIRLKQFNFPGGSSRSILILFQLFPYSHAHNRLESCLSSISPRGRPLVLLLELVEVIFICSGDDSCLKNLSPTAYPMEFIPPLHHKIMMDTSYLHPYKNIPVGDCVKKDGSWDDGPDIYY